MKKLKRQTLRRRARPDRLRFALRFVINTLSTPANDTCLTVEMQLLHTGTGAVLCKYERNGRKIGETSNMEDKGMNNEVSITALMSSFGRAFHAENEDHPVFADHLAKELMTAEEYAAVLTGTKQYVMLGAGLDTFAFREKEFLSKHRVF